MTDTAKRITVQEEDIGKGASFLYDLAIIMPLKKATLRVEGADSFTVFVGIDMQAGKEGESDITELCAEGDLLVLSFSESEKAPAFSAEVVLEFAGGVSRRIVTDEHWLYGDFTVSRDMTKSLSDYIFTTVPKICKSVKII